MMSSFSRQKARAMLSHPFSLFTFSVRGRHTTYIMDIVYRFLRWTISRRRKVLTILTVLAIALSVTGFNISTETVGVLDVINNTVALFLFDYPHDDNNFLDFAKLLCAATVFFGTGMIFAKRVANALAVKQAQNANYVLIIGLDDQNSALLKNWDDPTGVVVIEPGMERGDVSSMKSRGFGVIQQEIESALKSLNLGKMKNCIISLGNDQQNMRVTARMLELMPDQEKRAMTVRIENKKLSVLFRKQIVDRRRETDVVAQSFNELIAKDLLRNYSIFGKQPSIIETDAPWGIVVVGDSDLTMEIIFQVMSIAHLPNQNLLTIYSVGSDAIRFVQKLGKQFTAIGRVPFINVQAVTNSYDTSDFFSDPVWENQNITNIIIATGDQDQNLDIAINLQDTTYIDAVASNARMPMILVALQTEKGIGKYLNEKNSLFPNLRSFGDLSEVATKENLLDSKMDTIAKTIHYDYSLDGGIGNGEKVHVSDLEKAWLEGAGIDDRDSSRAQAMHMDIKLLAMGLVKRKAKGKPPEADLVEQNRQTLFRKMKLLDSSFSVAKWDEIGKNYTYLNFPADFIGLFNKIARSEHNRWMAFHYLRGWRYDTERNKATKRHQYLLPLEDFDSLELSVEAKETYINDMKSISNIPLYLGYAGYELIESTNDAGLTGNMSREK